MRNFAVVTLGLVFAIGVGVVCWETPRRMPAARIRDSEPELAQLAASSRAKRGATQRIICQRLSLLEAAELFREANGPAGLARLRSVMPTTSLQEQLCRQVVAYVQTLEAETASDNPDEPSYAAVLETEFECLLATGAFDSGTPDE